MRMIGHSHPDKNTLRAAMRARRDALSDAETLAATTAITDACLSLPLFADAAVLCSYLAIGNEVGTERLIREALLRGKRVVLPRTLLPERTLALHAVTDLDHLHPGRYGILEPAPDAPLVDPGAVDLFLVPGVAFDPAGNRLGYGAGLYDTLLAQSRGRRVALAHSCQVTPCVPADAHDVPMDLLVTEAGIIDCHRGRRPSDHLRLRNIQSYGHHGVFAEERAKGLRLAFDIDLRLDLQLPGITDHLATTVDYPAVYRLVERVQSGQQFLLLEALVEQIARTILAECPLVRDVTVTARKFNPPVGGPLDDFEVEITRSRYAQQPPVA